ncbi:DUF3016 domain-containing protein [Kangiella sediminilitoris]|uniref:DUF3016 domain-containing protein n=1 Tax=Kangiella sediminilitoris TaxID=1144748 RepID=A0A1B3BCF8_9GAMM|nr:DUF3016 domain-containing protein [Kangiella sediminilitoris]AOE50478.1 hypothetical protein KS2013_1769 [Kangiella sediminilitoris]
MYNFKSYITGIIALISLAMAPSLSVADAENDAKGKSAIEVTWGDFNDFRDVSPAMEPRGAFHERVKRSFDKFFTEYSEELPEGQTLVLKINDLDLAGAVQFGATNEFRVMKDVDFPRMSFSYKLLDNNKNVVKQGNASIKDMNYLHHEKTWKRSREGFYYEKRMFKEWVKENILN